MALIGRILVVTFAYSTASIAAAAVFVYALISGTFDDESRRQLAPILRWSGDPHDPIVWIVGLAAMVIACVMLIPAMLLVVVAEGLRLRSLLFYAAAGGAAGFVCVYGLSLHELPAHDVALTVEEEAAAAAGIVAGFVYWALAGHTAGGWRRMPQLRAR